MDLIVYPVPYAWWVHLKNQGSEPEQSFGRWLNLVEAEEISTQLGEQDTIVAVTIYWKKGRRSRLSGEAAQIVVDELQEMQNRIRGVVALSVKEELEDTDEPSSPTQ